MTSDLSRGWARRLRLLVTGVPFLVTAAVVAVLAVAYTLAGFFLVPRLITTYVPRYAQEQLQRRAELGEVRLNPLLFKLEIKDFRLQEADGRPRLKLTVHGGYEPKVDGEALRSLRVRQDLARRLEVKLKPGEDPGPVAVDHAKTQRALEALLTERGGAKAIEEVQTGYEKSTGKKAQRANPLLAFVGRGSPDRAFYEALFRRLVETAPLSDAEVTALGERRGEATARALKEGAGTAAARVEVGATEAAGRAERKSVPTRLELGAVGS